VPLAANRTIRTAEHERARIEVPAGGWQVTAEDVHFENIDFVAAPKQRTQAAGTGPGAAFIELRARRAEFRSCSWQSREPPRSVGWQSIGVCRTEPMRACPQENCVSATDCSTASLPEFAAAGQCRDRCGDLLHLGPGPLVELTGAGVRMIRCC